jgi:SAM-dependent methyltransferase
MRTVSSSPAPRTLTERLDARLYPGWSSNWDDQQLRVEILKVARSMPASRLLDLGAGAGIVRQMDLRDAPGRVCGVDLDPRVGTNPFLDTACVGDASSLPYRDGSFDIVYANNVLEHLPAPLDVFREVARVLRPGGWFLFKTPNRCHYVPAIAAVTPHRFHQRVAARRGRRHEDTFETAYRANTAAAIRRLAAAARLDVASLEFREGRPEYCRIHPALYLAGCAYERVVNATTALRRFRVVMIGALRRPS